MYNHIIENWWRHLGCYDREQVSDIPYNYGRICSVGEYLEVTDTWWERLTNGEKLDIYDNFFDES